MKQTYKCSDLYTATFEAVSYTHLIIEVAVSVLIHRRNHTESVLRVVCILVLDASQRVKHIPAVSYTQLSRSKSG